MCVWGFFQGGGKRSRFYYSNGGHDMLNGSGRNTHTQPFCFAPEVGGSLFFLLREEKKEPKTLGTKQSGPVLKELQSDTTCVLFYCRLRLFFFTIHHHYWYQPDWPGYHFHSYWQFFEEIFKNKFFWRVCGNFFIIFFLFVVNVFIVVMPGVTCNS